MSSKGPIRVLVVENHPVILWGLARLIDGEPRMEIAGLASCSQDALRLARETRPDVVLLDIELENAMTILPALIEASSARVLGLSAGQDPPVSERALRRGAWKTLSKDGSGASILSAIESIWCDKPG